MEKEPLPAPPDLPRGGLAPKEWAVVGLIIVLVMGIVVAIVVSSPSNGSRKALEKVREAGWSKKKIYSGLELETPMGLRLSLQRLDDGMVRPEQWMGSEFDGLWTYIEFVERNRTVSYSLDEEVRKVREQMEREFGIPTSAIDQRTGKVSGVPSVRLAWRGDDRGRDTYFVALVLHEGQKTWRVTVRCRDAKQPEDIYRILRSARLVVGTR